MGRRRTYRRLLAAFWLFVTATGVAAVATGLLNGVELRTVDLRFDVRGPRPAPADLLFVGIDTRTLVRHRYPLERKFHARVIDRLRRDGARAIAYDVQFTEPGPSAAQDEQLVDAVHRAAGRIVLATTEVDAHGATSILGGASGSLPYSGAVPAYSGLPNDPGGTLRRMATPKNGLPSLATATATIASGHRVVVPRGRTAWIDFPGPPGTVRTVSFEDVLEGRVPAAAVRGRIVVVGASALTLQDRHPTSTTGLDPMAGPEVHAAAIDTALRGFPLRSAPWWLDITLVLLLGALTPLVALRRHIGVALAVGAGTIVVLLAGAQIAFDRGLVVAVAVPLATALLALVATLGAYATTTAIERAFTRRMFARFVPEAVVDEVLAMTQDARLGGRTRDVTVLFSDLRGFTTFSEQRQADEVVEILNRYLTLMSDAILDLGGTVATYLGDGIMAVFGAPLAIDDHADRALAAGREMLARMTRFNAVLQADGAGDGFKMGIGLNSGEVMAGNVGSERRLEFTVIGDTVNTASRIEGLTKGTPHQLMLADATVERLSARPDDLVDVGTTEIRGRASGIGLWAATDCDYPGA